MTGVNPAHELGFGPQGVFHLLRVDDSVAAAGDDRQFVSLALEVSCRGSDGHVFQGADDEVAAAVGCETPHHAEQGQVVAFGPAGGEDDFVAVHSEQRGDPMARVVHGFPGRPAYGVMADGVTKMLGQEGKHCLLHGRCNGRCRVVVEIDRSHRGTRARTIGG